MQGAVWGEVEQYEDAQLDRCRLCMPVLGPLQTVLALQAFCPRH